MADTIPRDVLLERLKKAMQKVETLWEAQKAEQEEALGQGQKKLTPEEDDTERTPADWKALFEKERMKSNELWKLKERERCLKEHERMKANELWYLKEDERMKANELWKLKERERKLKEKERMRADKEQERADKEQERADTLQDILAHQGGNQNQHKIPVTLYKLVHKPDTSPCMHTSITREVGTFNMCTVKAHWVLEEKGTAAVEPEEEDINDKDDVLGGRDDDIPEDVHKEMVKLAAKDSIPITTPAKRRYLALKRRTYFGEMQFKLPVKYGYLHPTLPPPKGFFWKKLPYMCGLCPNKK